MTNLRWATPTENTQNSSKSKKNTSDVKGVVWDKSRNKWKAHVSIDGIFINLGRFDNIEDAKNVRITRANEAFGIFTN